VPVAVAFILTARLNLLADCGGAGSESSRLPSAIGVVARTHKKASFSLAQAGLPLILSKLERQNGTKAQNVKTNASSPVGRQKSNFLSVGLIEP
jgi:hypothetical protein